VDGSSPTSRMAGGRLVVGGHEALELVDFSPWI
jgi:hypothetical protein